MYTPVPKARRWSILATRVRKGAIRDMVLSSDSEDRESQAGSGQASDMHSESGLDHGEDKDFSDHTPAAGFKVWDSSRLLLDSMVACPFVRQETIDSGDAMLHLLVDASRGQVIQPFLFIAPASTTFYFAHVKYIRTINGSMTSRFI